jgi:hypothetical protein
MKKSEQFSEGIIRSLGHKSYRSISLICHPPHQVQSVRFPASILAKIDALHQAKHCGLQTSHRTYGHVEIIA